jgi:hypothetical protein
MRMLLGGGPMALAAGVAAGCVVMAAALWWFRGILQLSAMPGLSAISARWHR